MGPAGASGPAKLTVVVHTDDQVVLNYICPDRANAVPNVVATEVQSPGRFLWHVVGGVAPYTMLGDERMPGGSRCIMVQDAEGNVASGCGVVEVRVMKQWTKCSDRHFQDDKRVSGIAPKIPRTRPGPAFSPGPRYRRPQRMGPPRPASLTPTARR